LGHALNVFSVKYASRVRIAGRVEGVQPPFVVMTSSSSLIIHPRGGLVGTLPVSFVPEIKFWERPSGASKMQENVSAAGDPREPLWGTYSRVWELTALPNTP